MNPSLALSTVLPAPLFLLVDSVNRQHRTVYQLNIELALWISSDLDFTHRHRA
ncbi:hypothetical protein [Nitrosococcus wardiae]|uniref:hypothetical protein n=1 Tax=Nitrosococcus wardiae TaxID=1814290 RepID=UPI00141ADE86|nr:hypothetical protein [Nitrosococcus wardiae]